MTPEPTPNPSGSSSFAGLFTAGLVALFASWLLLLGLSYPITKPETFAVALMWTISRWWIPFIFGAVVLVVRAVASRRKPGAALTAYLVPGLVMAAISGLCVTIYPEADFRSQMLDLMPLTLLFYLFGLAWVRLAKTGGVKSSMLRAVLPPSAGGIAIAAMIAVPVFRGNPFVYRDAFAMDVSKVVIEGGQMVADGTLEVRKAGDYEFSAPRFSYLFKDDGSDFESMIEHGQITWGAAGPPKNGATGSHTFQIRWQKNLPATMDHLRSGMSEESSVFMEVHKPGTDRGELLINLSAAIPGAP